MKDYREVINMDVLRFMYELSDKGRLTNGANCTFIVPIPTKENPQTLLDFLPISLVESMYKVLSKMLANRFQESYW